MGINFNEIKKSNSFMYITISVISTLIFVSIYGVKVINPTYVDWLLAEGGDLAQHYLGRFTE